MTDGSKRVVFIGERFLSHLFGYRDSFTFNSGITKRVINMGIKHSKHLISKTRSDWSFKDPNEKPEDLKLSFTKAGVIVRKKKVIKKKKNSKPIEKTDDFYKSNDWLKLRYRVIRKYGGECMACGRSKKRHGITIHVDHILPRSKFPRQALRFENLQILCDECNIGKSNIDYTDWRPDSQQQDDAEMELVLSAIQAL